MKRTNGYIDLDSYYEDLDKKKLDTLIKPSDYSDEHFWLTIDEEDYYFKATNFPYNELVCYEIAKLLGMDALEYDLAKFKNFYGVISKNYKKPGYKYIPGYDILKKYYDHNKEIVEKMGLSKINWQEDYESPCYIHMNNLETIWTALEYSYPCFDISPSFLKIVNQFIFIILTAQEDKGSQNWEAEESENSIDIVNIFDNESAYLGYDCEVAMSTNFDDACHKLMDVLKTFLNLSSQEFVNLFLEKYNLLSEEAFLNILDIVEVKTGVNIPESEKTRLISNFKNNRENIKIVLEELKIDNNLGRK